MQLAESSSLRHQDAQIRDPEEEKKTYSPEPVMKKQEESPGSLSMKELVMKLVTKKQKGERRKVSLSLSSVTDASLMPHPYVVALC